MRVLLTGANGLIGSAVLARLASEGHEVVAVLRPGAALPGLAAAAARVELDMAKAAAAADWRPHLAGVEAVVNCAGVLQDSPRDSTGGVHFRGADALFAACEAAGVRRVIHLSAIGVDRETPTSFSRTKIEGDRALMARDLDWVILRPSVVVGRAAYGGSALFRGLAALPVVPALPEGGKLQIVQLDDLVRTVAFFLRPETPRRVALELAGPDRLSMGEVVALYRKWLGHPPARIIRLPPALLRLGYRLGDLAGLLGWRPPIRSTAEREMVRGAVGDPGPWTAMTGIEPVRLAAALAAEPPSVQERWFAPLYFLKALALAVFALFWIGTGLVSLGPGWEIGVSLMRSTAAAPLAEIGVVAGALTDITLGVALLFRRTTRLALYGTLLVSLFYAVTGTILAPELWRDPLGPMLKIWPIMVLNLIALAILRER